MRDHRLSISTVSCGISRTGVLEARKQKERGEVGEWSSHGRPVAAKSRDISAIQLSALVSGEQIAVAVIINQD